VFIGAYCESLFGIGGWMIYLAFYIIFIGIHIFGVGEALKLMFVITAVAAIALAVFLVSMVPHFNVANLLDIPVTEAKGASTFLPFGYVGVWAAIPYAIWFFLAVEGVPLAAEETKNPKRDLPRGLIGAIVVLTSFALLILVIAPGGAGTYALIKSGNPLVEALALSYGGSTWMGSFVNLVGLAGLIASFFSIIYAYSRQIFALSRAGYLPRKLSETNKSKAPVLALVIPGVIGFGLSLTGQGDLLILVAVFGATISYVLMMAAHITLRIRRPKMDRPYRTPGGIFTSGVALVLACVAVVAGFLVDPRVVIGAAIIYGVLIAYFAFYSRHHLVAGTPEEEFAAIQAAEAALH
jgi:ethanolamine permease